MTSVALPVVRGPFALAKSLGAIDLLSGGRLDAGLGPGSSQADYALVGIPFTERWARFDESIGAMRALWAGDRPPFVGRYYDTTGVALSPPPLQPKGPPIWIGSWGSTAGLRRVARLADGWLASGYNSTPEQFTAAWGTLRAMLEADGRDPSTFPCAMATTWLYITDDETEARAVSERLSDMLRRPVEEVEDRLPIGSPARCVDLLGRYRAAGLQRVLLWPVKDEVRQMELVARDVLPQLGSRALTCGRESDLGIATVASPALPVWETGSDPTRLPVWALAAPIGAALVTTLASVVAGIFSQTPE